MSSIDGFTESGRPSQSSAEIVVTAFVFPHTPSGRHLHQGEPDPAGERHGSAVVVGKLLAEHDPQLGSGQRFLGHRPPTGCHHRVEIDADQLRRVLGVADHLALQHRLEDGSHLETIAGRDQVDGAAHHHDAHQLSILQESTDLVGVEAGEAGPQGQVRAERQLRLHADEVLHGLEDTEARALEQMLAGQGRPVQRAVGQGVGRHRSILPRPIATRSPSRLVAERCCTSAPPRCDTAPMPTHIFRVTVKGRFADLDQAARDRLRAELDRYDYSLAGYTDGGTFMYDRMIDFFTFRVRLRELSDDWDEAHDAVRERGEAMARQVLDGLGVGCRDLKVRADDMADVWR